MIRFKIITIHLLCVHSLTNIEVQRYYQKNISSKVFQNNLYVVNLDEYKTMVTHWITLYTNGNSVTYFDSFGVEHIPKKSKKYISSFEFE